MKDETPSRVITDIDLLTLQQEEDSALEFRERKHDDWTENYTLYRDKVITNRLTQRQTVNIPLMRYVLNTLLKEMTDFPQLYYNNLSNDQQKEIYYNEYWKEVVRRNKLAIKDFIDKKQNALFGRAFKKINIEDGKCKISLVDPQCMLVHRFVDPSDIDSAPSLTETDIFVTLEEILENEEYDEQAKRELELYFSEEGGELESDENFQRASEKSDRLKNIGVDDAENPLLGETYVELHETYRKEWHDEKGKKVIFRYVLASTGIGLFKLHKAELTDVIGKTSDDFWEDHFPYTSWAGDPEATDFWSDGVADIIRQINKVLNVWFSQLVENRTLQNFGMKYYDSTDKKFVPQTYAPKPFGWYPTPGDPNKIIKDVQTGNLTGTLEEMSFIISVAEKATAATSANSGSVEARKVTLGEVEYALANAQKRIQQQQLFYVEDWKDVGIKYSKFLEASGENLEPLTIYKKGRLGKKMYKKVITLGDWNDEEGYLVEVSTVTEHQEEQVDMVERLNILRNEMPDNAPLIEIYRRKLMELGKLTPEEISQIEEFEKQKSQNPIEPEIIPGEGQPAQAGVPAGGLPEVPDIVQR